MGGVCRGLNTDPLDPWFDWLVIATYQGNQSCLSTAGAPVCEVWSLNMPDRGLGLTLYVANQVPYQYIISQQGKTIDSVYNYTYAVPTVLFEPPAPSSFEAASSCTQSYAAPCPYSPLRPVLPMIRFHPPNDTSLVNQNTGDILGDTGFLCITLLGNETGEFQQLSWYDVQINFTFGGYSYCNFGNCVGGDPFLF